LDLLLNKQEPKKLGTDADEFSKPVAAKTSSPSGSATSSAADESPRKAGLTSPLSPSTSSFWKKTLAGKGVASEKYDIDKFTIRDPRRHSVVIRIAEISEPAAKWWRKRIKLTEQPGQLRQVWKVQLDTTPGAMGVVDFKELRLFVEATLNNPNKEYINKMDERLQLWIVNKWNLFVSSTAVQVHKYMI
jgi:hypothetical protein